MAKDGGGSGFAGQGGSFGAGTIGAFGGAANDIFSGIASGESLHLKAQGDRTEAENYDLAAKLAGDNALFQLTTNNVKNAQADRQNYLGIGTEVADISGAGFSLDSGTSLDLMRSAAQQGALNKALTFEQGQMSEAGFQEQQTSYKNLAEYARLAADKEDSMGNTAKTMGYISAGIKIVTGIAAMA